MNAKQKIIILAALQLIGINARIKTVKLPVPQIAHQSCEVVHYAA